MLPCPVVAISKAAARQQLGSGVVVREIERKTRVAGVAGGKEEPTMLVAGRNKESPEVEWKKLPGG